ncbi:MAG TPA: hypothetical protein VGK90_05355 [Rhizomicrobium sp.]|jgi:hypothetical protein
MPQSNIDLSPPGRMASTTILTLDGPVSGVPGAFVREVHELPAHLPGGTRIAPWTEALPGALLFEVPRIARFLIKDGQTIDVLVAEGADRSAVKLFLETSARGTLIHQRGELALNAVTLIAPDWKCVTICAPSGFGKSTLAAVLCRNGWTLLADNITRVTWSGTMAVAWPDDARLKLWRDVCEAMRLDPAKLERVRDKMEKYYIPGPSATTPARLSIIVVLRLAERASSRALNVADNVFGLTESTFRTRQIDPLGMRAVHTRIVDQIAGCCRGVLLEGGRRAPVADVARRLAEAIR